MMKVKGVKVQGCMNVESRGIEGETAHKRYYIMVLYISNM